MNHEELVEFVEKYYSDYFLMKCNCGYRLPHLPHYKEYVGDELKIWLATDGEAEELESYAKYDENGHILWTQLRFKDHAARDFYMVAIGEFGGSKLNDFITEEYEDADDADEAMIVDYVKIKNHQI